VANPGEEDIHITLHMVNPDGTIWRTLSPPVLNPLKAGCHVSRFFWEDLQDPELSFRGSAVLHAEGGKTFSVIALLMNKGLYSAIPVIPAKAPNLGTVRR
jgi:hypothetical protein